MIGRRLLCIRKQNLILFLFASVATLCLVAAVYFLDNRLAVNKVQEVFEKIQSATAKTFGPPIPEQYPHDTEINSDRNVGKHVPRDQYQLGTLSNDVDSKTKNHNSERGKQNQRSALPNGEDADPIARKRRDKVREVRIKLLCAAWP